MEQPQFNLLGELKILYVKIPLLQTLHDVPIYAKIVWDLCVRKPGRKPRDPPTIHVIGKLYELIMEKPSLSNMTILGTRLLLCILGTRRYRMCW